MPMIRSYSYTTGDDIHVTDYQNGPSGEKLDEHYQNIAEDRKNIRLEAHVDLYRSDSGELFWSGGPNGRSINAARAFRLLLDLMICDLAPDTPAPRAIRG